MHPEIKQYKRIIICLLSLLAGFFIRETQISKTKCIEIVLSPVDSGKPEFRKLCYDV